MQTLDTAEVRVLGALIEKEATTPEYYPLSANALVNACNQKSNRDPVVSFDEDIVLDAIERLRGKQFAFIITGSGRVQKFSQRFSETLNLGRRELAVMCVLMLRGPQTLGEIRDRTERLYSFSDPAEVETVLQKLADWPSASLAKQIARQPGQKEARYAHLLSGEPVIEVAAAGTAESASAPTRVAQLETQLLDLRRDFEDLKRRFEALEQQLR